MNRKQKQEFVSRMKTVFQNLKSPPQKHEMVRSFFGEENEQIQREFTGKHWHEVSVEMLHDNYYTIQFFSPKAFRYYLPAFVEAIILYPEKVNDLPDEVVSYLVPPNPGASKYIQNEFERVARIFKKDEKSFIVEFLEVFSELVDNRADFYLIEPHDVKRAISYWKNQV